METHAYVGAPVDATTARRPERRTFEGAYVRLEPLSTAHARDLFEATHGADKDAIWRYLFVGPFEDFASFEKYCAAGAQAQDPMPWAVIDRRSGKAAGSLSLMRIEPVHRVVEVGGITYGSALQRTTGSTEAIYLLARYIFDDLGYRRFEWKCNDLNAPSRSAALRYGFSFEGVFRQHMIVKGRNRDTAWYSMLDSEWPASKTAYEAWLDPSNFDANGRQLQSLSAILGYGGI
ncbi:MAG: GNAT family N-acetyltransferase [Hyphomicrobiales bacterium]|nr:GNAT family N-acetyltransferase [Hyphomicrobiales bacterium]